MKPSPIALQKPMYKSLIKTRVYMYEGRPVTSRMSKVIKQGQEERSRMDRHNKLAVPPLFPPPSLSPSLTSTSSSGRWT